MLEEYAEACFQVAREKNVPLLDLHGKSIAFILQNGQTEAAKYFYPKDWTHHNDFGGFLMAKFIVDAIKETGIESILPFLRDIPEDTLDLFMKTYTGKASNLKQSTASIQSTLHSKTYEVPEYQDLDVHWAKKDIIEIARRGIIRSEGELFKPYHNLSKVDFMAMVLKVTKYCIINVYNDMYTDVFGDEWYAGTIQAAYNSGFFDERMTPNRLLEPQKDISLEDALVMIVNAYRSKKDITEKPSVNLTDLFDKSAFSSWALDYLQSALEVGLLTSTDKAWFNPKAKLTKAEAAVLLKRLSDLI